MTGTSTATVTASSVNDETCLSCGLVRASVCISVLWLSGCVAQTKEIPTDAPATEFDDEEENDTSFNLDDVQEPPVPYVGGSDADFPLQDEPTEIDCVDAEELCDTGAFACDDIADYCDIGPDGLGELPDEYDWDGG